MSSVMNDEIRRILRGRRNAWLATLMSDGSPQLTPVWIDLTDDDFVVVNTWEGAVKLANMRRNGRVAVAIESEGDRYRVVTLRGVAVAFEGGDAVDEHVDALSLRHDGTPWTPEEDEVRVTVRIRVDRVLLLED